MHVDNPPLSLNGVIIVISDLCRVLSIIRDESKVGDTPASKADALDGVRGTLLLLDQVYQKGSIVSIYRTIPLIIGQPWNAEVALELEVKVWKARNLVDRETRFFGKGVSVQGGRLLRAFFYANLNDTW